MDPDATLAQIRKLCGEIAAEQGEVNGPVDLADQAFQLAHLVTALDLWMSRGGFKPAAWTEPTETTRSN